jgi:hypothetical protein
MKTIITTTYEYEMGDKVRAVGVGLSSLGVGEVVSIPSGGYPETRYGVKFYYRRPKRVRIISIDGVVTKRCIEYTIEHLRKEELKIV